MPYIVFVVICIVLTVLSNIDMFVKSDNSVAIKPYRAFIVSLVLFYISDIFWGAFKDYQMGEALYYSTFFYFFFLGLTILLWSDFVVRFIDGNRSFAVALKIAGLLFFIGQVTLLVINFFAPILYRVDEAANYVTYLGRDIMLYVQMGMYSLITIYAIFYVFAHRQKKTFRHSAMAAFSIIMVVSIIIQLLFPLYPLYSAGCLIGSSVIEVVALSDTKDRFKKAYQKTSEMNVEHVEKLNEAISIANTDSLTGVKSRYAYVEMEQSYDDRIAKGLCDNFAVVVLDINDLKIINDSFGHDAGDEHIKSAVRIMASCFPFESIYRFGGDEFVVVLEGEGYTSRQKRMNNFVNIINENTKLNGQPVVASGLAAYRKENDHSFRAIFNRADRIMFANKESLKEQQ